MFKKILGLALASTLLFTGCSAGNNDKKDDKTSDNGKDKPVVLQVAFENSMSEPLGQGVQKWADLLSEKSNGNMKIEIFPDSQMGDKADIIDSMLIGENVCTLADGAFYADYGVNDFGIV